MGCLAVCFIEDRRRSFRRRCLRCATFGSCVFCLTTNFRSLSSHYYGLGDFDSRFCKESKFLDVRNIYETFLMCQ